MTKEEIIATAIHEAFRCGKEAGEESQRRYAKMQQEIDRVAEQGKPDYDPHQYDGFLPQVELSQLKEENSELAKKCTGIQCDYNVLKHDYEKLEKRAVDLALENEKLGKIMEDKDATITELRRELQANKDADTLLCDENKRLLESLNKKDAELADLQHKYDELYAVVNPLAIIKPQVEKVPAEPSHFSEGDKVIVSGAYFGEAVPDHHGVIVEVMKHVARVLITEKDSDYEDDEYRILYEYLKKI